MTQVISSFHPAWYHFYMKPSLTLYRRATQVLFIVLVALIPVFDIFRYDTATRELFLFGRVWELGLNAGFASDQTISGAGHVALQFFLKAVLPWIVILAIFPLLGWLTGRLFCGWLCPEGALFELSDHLTLKLTGKRSLFTLRQNEPDQGAPRKLYYGSLALVSAVIIPLAGGVALTGYLVAPATIWGQILAWKFTFGVQAGILGVAIYMLVTSILVRHVLCRYVCAAGLMQMLFGWVSPVSLRLNMDRLRISECTDCKGCDKACFMNVTPRKNKLDISCVNCGACIEACNRELGAGKGLFHLGFGGRKCALPEENCRSLIPREGIKA